MSILSNKITTDQARCTTAHTFGQTRYYNGQNDDDDDEVYEILLHTIWERGKKKEVIGLYTLRDRGMDTPCWVWSLNYRGDEPIVRTYYTTYTPRGLMKRRAGVKGVLVARCGFKDCISPKHLTLRIFKKHMEGVRSNRRPQERDERGRFVSPDPSP